MSALEPSLIVNVFLRITEPFSLNSTVRLPGSTLNGPATAAVLTPVATDFPIDRDVEILARQTLHDIDLGVVGRIARTNGHGRQHQCSSSQ